LVSHDLDLVKKYADKVILLDKEVKKQGKVDEVFNSEEYKNIFGQD
jgi:zinc transport system ATP-binding protein